jgi:hypothetical protein
MILDFILALPNTAEGYNYIISLTNKFSKAVLFMPGAITWTDED